MKLGTHVAAGLMVAGGIAALAAGGVFLVGGAAVTAVKIGMTVFLAGSLYVGEQALSDIRSGRVSDLDRYTRKAVAGSVVGFLTGASGLLMAEASLLGVLALGFGEGLVGSIVTQKLLNEDGEIDWGVAIEGGMLSLAMAGFMRSVGRSVKGVGGGGEALEGGLNSKYLEQLNDFSENKIHHIINGSKGSNHGWENLVPDKNWNDIKTIIGEVMETGVEGPYKTVYSKKAIINGFEVEVTYTKLSDGTIKISDAWINQ